jgi:SAM-dependent methyltransferase
MSTSALMETKATPDRSSPTHSGWRARVFAFLLLRVNEKYERLMGARKRTSLVDLRGTVLEIGPGAGVNLKHYDPSVQWIGIEPNPYLRGYLEKEAERCGLQVDLRTGNAEQLDVADQSMDAVLCTLVLCSVRDVRRVLKEIHRVLKPGARFVFIEHVAAPRGNVAEAFAGLVQAVARSLRCGMSSRPRDLDDYRGCRILQNGAPPFSSVYAFANSLAIHCRRGNSRKEMA